MEDLVAEAEMNFVPGYKEIIEEVLAARTRWSEFASRSGVGGGTVAKIAAEIVEFRPL